MMNLVEMLESLDAISEPAEKEVSFRYDEWAEFCRVMNRLTWGKGMMDDWHSLRERINERVIKRLT